jgi:NAD(P)-dependent dehydrogenase (short-subunit alcohol dehydrogenase family)
VGDAAQLLHGAARDAAAPMVAQGCGAIVNVRVNVPSTRRSDDSAKAAVVNLTRRSREFGPQGIRINAVSPGS